MLLDQDAAATLESVLIQIKIPLIPQVLDKTCEECKKQHIKPKLG